ncbi:AHH domain-containing protein [Microbulbifer sp. OS29]|uniref:AHH domain-containing protein n=1 Tax=Microbulbifer okhotskensis TaxID=2926617 RepID=A0A9X2ERZ1_9GAMM|nr:AHH domain-containing protein [Microbulbifer okhotskensis]MCO1336305.1 AHH domain-containing protein [Microbulbifer okhotskensis]
MGHYEQPKPYYLKDRREVAIDRFVSKKNLTRADYMALKVIDQVEETLDKYRQESVTMSRKEIREEEHDSTRLGKFMEKNGKPHPGGNCDAHAIVSGGHSRATPARAILARVGIRIDDIRNGTWLPRSTADTPHPKMPEAIPHSRIHRLGYYMWLEDEFARLDISDITEENVTNLLRGIEYDLKFSSFPHYVMLPADEVRKHLGA